MFLDNNERELIVLIKSGKEVNGINEKYIEIIKKSSVYLTKDGDPDERHAVSGKIYRVLDEKIGWYMIEFGRIKGWVPSECCKVLDYSPLLKMTVAWDAVRDKQSNKEHYQRYINKSSYEQGLDVISPTWFTREGDAEDQDSIKLVDKSDREYVKLAHSNGYEVWGLIADFNYDRNYAVYTNPELVKREIRSIVEHAVSLDLDGINIDFEGFGSRCREHFSSYVRDLSRELKKHNMVVSIDVTKESDSDAWGKCYDRLEISKYVDYIALMAYDEHGRLNVFPGSTGSLPWVEEAIVELLEKGIPREKLLLGVPFYTRDWMVRELEVNETSVIVSKWEGIALYERPDKDSKKMDLQPKTVLKYLDQKNDWYQVEKEGKIYYIPVQIATVIHPGETVYINEHVSALPSKNISVLIRRYEGTVTYDDRTKQDRVVYTDEAGFRHEVWVENTKSMDLRMKLIHQYHLPGIAAWMLTHENEEMWKVIKKNLKKKSD
jgi:spore germination protein YaaH